MKKIVYTALLALAATGLGACTTEVEDAFDTSASERIEQKTLECKTLLTSAEYGWMIEYYPDSQQSYGGSTYAAKFDTDGSVTVTGQIAVEISGDVTQTVTSHYSINASSSVLLTFDTYNEYLHYWSDPDFFGGNDFDGDFEFAYVSGNAQEMIFRGIKTGNRIVFTALEEELVSSIQSIADIENAVADKLYYAYRWNAGEATAAQADEEGNEEGNEEGDGEETPVENTPVLYSSDEGNLLTYYPDGDLEGAYETYPYAFTSEGIRLYNPVTIDGITVQEFAWDDEAEHFVSIDAKDAAGTAKTVTLDGFHADGFLHYDQFIGTYSVPCFSSYYERNTTLRVTLTEKSRYHSYTLHGLDAAGMFDIEVAYSKTGMLSINTQGAGTYRGMAVMLCPLTTDGYLTWSPVAGFNLTHNNDLENLVLTFRDNGMYSSALSGLLFGAFSGGSFAGMILYVDDLSTMTKL